MNLYEQLETLAAVMGRDPVPDFVSQGLANELRPYQNIAITDFIRYFKTDNLRVERPTQSLFHMATGSGKTVVMSALILYLYEQGYRHFLFFVNSTNVLEKTRNNFLDSSSPKYLFASDLKINGQPLAVQEVTNFQITDPEAVNIRFVTIQGLHAELTNPREGGLSEDDFDEVPVVFISDEAHHLNALTRQGLSADEQATERSWEGSVNRVFGLNRDNLLLEFTATCDLSNAAIAAKYANKIIADYPLRRYREDRYSKEIKLLQSDLPDMQRSLQALVLSHYRFKLFQKNGLTNKPVILFKSKTIKDNVAFYADMALAVSTLDPTTLRQVSAVANAGIAKRAFDFFKSEGISFDALAAEMREEFGEDHCLVLDSQNISPEKQRLVNSLEDKRNPIRAVFAVDMLNEGWDVLNLFDIVRLYSTRDARSGRPGKTTIQEAQLVGRGARYCPFKMNPEQDMYRRKYDDDVENEMRACEELYFHSVTNERYINELTTALRETGALPDRSVEVQYELKPDFKNSDFFRNGWVFLNERVERPGHGITSLPDTIRRLDVEVEAAGGGTHLTDAFGRSEEVAEVQLHSHRCKLADLPKPVVAKALRKNDDLRFDQLRRRLPNLSSLREFVEDSNYLGEVQLTLRTPQESPSREQLLLAADTVLARVAELIKGTDLDYLGTKDFKAHPIRETFSDHTCYVENPAGDGRGIPQRHVREGLRLDLAELDWYAYNENYGTTEEKSFLFYFNGIVGALKRIYETVYVLRNEREIGIYDFDTGRKFQPDFLLFLQKDKGIGFEQYQIFVEPKGGHLAQVDRWKEELLLRLENEARTVKRFADDNDYLIWGVPFYTVENPDTMWVFKEAMERFY